MASALKKAMRKDIAQLLSTLTKDEIKMKSDHALIAVQACGVLHKGQKVGIYVSTDGEIITDGFIDLLFSMNKDVYIPNFKRGQPDMAFVRLTQSEWKAGLPSTLWNIRQHEDVDPSQLLDSPLDLLLMPGVAFAANEDRTIKRLGHGAGYFDRFLHQHEEKYGRLPYLVGLALREQLVRSVPLEDHDVSLNRLIVEQTVIN